MITLCVLVAIVPTADMCDQYCRLNYWIYVLCIVGYMTDILFNLWNLHLSVSNKSDQKKPQQTKDRVHISCDTLYIFEIISFKKQHKLRLAA